MNQDLALLCGEWLKRYDRDGYVIVPGLLSSSEVSELKTSFVALGASGPVPGLSDWPPGAPDSNDPLNRWPRMMNPHRHPEFEAGRLARRYLLDPRFISIIQELFGEEPLAAQSMFYFKPPGARGQAFHQDNFYLRARPGTCMAAWIAIDPSTEENGGLQVVPRTQTLELQCPEEADLTESFVNEYVAVPAGLEALPANLAAGDVLFFNGSTIHGSGPNRSHGFRRSLIFHYVPSSCEQLAQWYQPLLRPDGGATDRAKTMDGGPCGAVALAPH